MVYCKKDGSVQKTLFGTLVRNTPSKNLFCQVKRCEIEMTEEKLKKKRFGGFLLFLQ